MQNLQNSRVKSNFHNLTIQDPLGLNGFGGPWHKGNHYSTLAKTWKQVESGRYKHTKSREELVTLLLDKYLKILLKQVKSKEMRLVEYSCTNELLTVKIERI